MLEYWKTIYIDGKPTAYKVSNMGSIQGVRKNRLKPSLVCNYLQVCIIFQGKRYNKKVHRLVAEAFIPNPNDLPQVNHIDENSLNNCVDNLEWCTPSYNTNYGTRNERVANKEMTPIIAINIHNLRDILYFKGVKYTSNLKFTYSKVSGALNNHYTHHKGYKWYYLRDFQDISIPEGLNI